MDPKLSPPVDALVRRAGAMADQITGEGGEREPATPAGDENAPADTGWDAVRSLLPKNFQAADDAALEAACASVDELRGKSPAEVATLLDGNMALKMKLMHALGPAADQARKAVA